MPGCPPDSFLSTPSARRATGFSCTELGLWAISIHALCEEGDRFWPPLRLAVGYFYPRPLRGGRPSPAMNVSGVYLISIHALCEEGDMSGPW